MVNTKARYLYSKANNNVYAYYDEDEFNLTKIQYPNDVEVTEETAYLTMFEKICKTMAKRFSNYNQLDIMQECYYMMLKRYREKGLFAPDKQFIDNVRIWWNFAKKSCLYIIRRFSDKHLNDIDIWDIEDNETDTSLCLGKCDEYNIGEHEAGVQDILDTIDRLSVSSVYADQQLGIYAKCKLNGLSDTDACMVLEIKMPRLYEIKRQLKEYLNSRFGKLI